MEKPCWMANKCSECIYYQPIINEKKEYVRQGFCKEDVPTPLKTAELKGAPVIAIGQGKQEVIQPQINSFQPVVAHNWAACGKFKAMPQQYMLTANGMPEEAKA